MIGKTYLSPYMLVSVVGKYNLNFFSCLIYGEISKSGIIDKKCKLERLNGLEMLFLYLVIKR